MSSSAEVVVLVEGPTERQFVKEVLAPYLANKGVWATPIILDKPGEKGGDVKFERARNDIRNHLRQRPHTYLTLMVDYYAIKSDWPGYEISKRQPNHTLKAEVMNDKTTIEVVAQFGEFGAETRFIPYVSMHEIEALYYSQPQILAKHLNVPVERISRILEECGTPENINDHFETTPARRLEKLSGRFKKKTIGIAIAREIGVELMKMSCPLFGMWVDRLESLTSGYAE